MLKWPNFDDGVKISQGTLTSMIPSDSPTLGDHVSSKSASIKLENWQIHVRVAKLTKC